MKYYHNLYLSDELKEKKEGIIYKLEHDKIQLNKYVIVLAENANNNLEFYDTALLLQRGWKKRRLLVVGIADGFEEALYLVEKIALFMSQKHEFVSKKKYQILKKIIW